jgi:probable rRNA maturation factor
LTFPHPVKKAETFCLLNRQRKHPIDASTVKQFLAKLETTEDVALGQSQLSFSVVFVTDAVMREYNRRYRHMDKPTDVLSFEGEGDYLGDIVVSTETAWKQAEQSTSLSFMDNIRRLVLHGYLHLRGYDHEVDNGEMRTLERRLRKRFAC